MSDADLVRFLDGETEDAEHAALAARIDADPTIARRLESLRGRTAEVSTWLDELGPDDHTVAAAAAAMRPRLGLDSGPARVASAPLLRAAAIILLLAAAALVVPPARAWVLDALERLVAAVGTGGGRDPLGAPASPTEPGPEITLTFPVDADTIVVYVTGRPAGTLLLTKSAAERASAAVHGGPNASLVYLPTGLHIESGADSSAVFDVKLPPRARSVVIRIGAGPDVAYAVPGDPGWRKIIELVRP